MRNREGPARNARHAVARLVDEAARLHVVRDEAAVVVAEVDERRVDKGAAALVRKRLAERVVGEVRAVPVGGY